MIREDRHYGGRTNRSDPKFCARVRAVDITPRSAHPSVLTAEHRLDPDVVREGPIVSPRQLRQHCDAMDDLLHVERFGIETLRRQIVEFHYALLLTDANAVTVDFIEDLPINNLQLKTGRYLGADWKERNADNCVIEPCIATGEALNAHQIDHFDATHIPLPRTAAPLCAGRT